MALGERLVSGAVLWREMIRTSRRWQTYAARAGFSGVLLGLLVMSTYALTRLPWLDPSNFAYFGRALYIVFGLLLTGMALLLAPLLCASAIVEEREDRTLDILALTGIQPGVILASKTLSRVVILWLICLGASPGLVLVVQLGGVSPWEVVALVAHVVIIVLLNGVLGSMFALFSKQPMLAALGSALYFLPVYLGVPLVWMVLSLNPLSAGQVSPLFSSLAQDWTGVLPLLLYLPSALVVFGLAHRIFPLKIASAGLRRTFAASPWGAKWAGVAFVMLLILGFVVFPAAWALPAAKAPAEMRHAVLGAGLVWLSLSTALATWVYVRIGSEVIDTIDAILGQRGRTRRRSRGLKVWGNPVAWAELRGSVISRNMLPVLFAIGVGDLLVLNSFIWLVPGGLLLISGAHALGGLALTAVLATQSFVKERRDGSLDVLVITPLPSWRIVLGKAAGVAVPTAPLWVVAVLTLPMGQLYLDWVASLGNRGTPMNFSFTRGVLASGWLLGCWLFVTMLCFAVSLRVKRPASAFGVMGVGLLMALIVPVLVGRVWSEVWWLSLPMRLIAAPLAGGAGVTAHLFSVLLVWSLGLVSMGLISWRLRRWVMWGLPALLGCWLAGQSGEAWAQEEPQPPLRIEAAALFEGYSRNNVPLAIRVQVVNEAVSVRGELVPSKHGYDDALPLVRQVSVPNGSRQAFTYVTTGASLGGKAAMQLRVGDVDVASAPLVLQGISEETLLIGVVGEDQAGIYALREGWSGAVLGGPTLEPGDLRKVRVGLSPVSWLPEMAAGYRILNVLVWPAADPTQLNAAQLEAMLGWVSEGGHLVITVSDSGRAVAQSALAEALPGELGGASTVESDVVLGALGAGLIGDGSAMTVANMRWAPRPGRASAVLAGDQAQPIWVANSYGLGSVSVLLADPRELPMSASAREAMWRRVLWVPETNASQYASGDQGAEARRLRRALGLWGRSRLPEGAALPVSMMARLLMKEGYEKRDYGDAIREWLADVPGLAPIPMTWLVLFSAAYLLVVGPLDYAALRLIGRQPLTWLTFPVWVLLFSGGALWVTSQTKGHDGVLKQFEAFTLLPGTDRAHAEHWIGAYTASRTSFTLTPGLSAGMVGLQSEPGYARDASLTSEGGLPTLKWNAETWTLSYTHSEGSGVRTGQFSLVRDGNVLRLENHSGVDMGEGYVVVMQSDLGFPPGVYAVAQLQDGGSRELGGGPVSGPTPSALFDRDEFEKHPLGFVLAQPSDASELRLERFDAIFVGEALSPIALPTLTGLKTKPVVKSTLRAPLMVQERSP